MEWKPSRWITSSSPKDTEPKSAFWKESLTTPKKGTYVAWSDGVRPCPGKKFSQVEFVAAMASLFRGHRVEVVPNLGEKAQEARDRVKRCVNDNRIVLLLQMRDPNSVGLRWVEV
jgi:cytochrome P450